MTKKYLTVHEHRDEYSSIFISALFQASALPNLHFELLNGPSISSDIITEFKLETSVSGADLKRTFHLLLFVITYILQRRQFEDTASLNGPKYYL